jgi:hypothetical protein
MWSDSREGATAPTATSSAYAEGFSAHGETYAEGEEARSSRLDDSFGPWTRSSQG